MDDPLGSVAQDGTSTWSPGVMCIAEGVWWSDGGVAAVVVSMNFLVGACAGGELGLFLLIALPGNFRVTAAHFGRALMGNASHQFRHLFARSRVLQLGGFKVTQVRFFAYRHISVLADCR